MVVFPTFFITFDMGNTKQPQSETQQITIELSEDIVQYAKDTADDREMELNELLEHILKTELQKLPWDRIDW